MQQDQASFCHLKGLLCTRNKLIALNKKMCYQNASQTVRNGPGFTAGWLIWLVYRWYFYLLESFTQDVVDSAMSLGVLVYKTLCTLFLWSKRSWSDAVPKDKAVMSPLANQMEPVPLFSSIASASQFLVRLKYVEQTAPPRDWAESTHNSQTVFSRPGKFQQ